MGDTCRDDLVELSDYAWQRLERRMAGLTDAEYLWEPVPGCRTVRRRADGTYRSDGPARPGDRKAFTTLAWRLCHIADLLREERNGPWLGQPAPPSPEPLGEPGTAADALAELAAAHNRWRTILTATTEESLAEPIGAVAGHYGDASRRSFVLHILDEVIHHGAEAALMRDLYAASARTVGPRS
jgi:DinB family protein